ncbi:MAG: hypothetical protein DHS20C16_27010 [Phycisphaerae bacterium]|nr:MAG: hypothetical protein DHS20C16_27010 [Phycisphaerae bacterium]
MKSEVGYWYGYLQRTYESLRERSQRMFFAGLGSGIGFLLALFGGLLSAVFGIFLGSGAA